MDIAMRRFVLASFLVLSACTTTTPAPSGGAAPASGATPAAEAAAAPRRSANALTPVASLPRTIADPTIRVGLLIDQPEVTSPRAACYVVTDQGPSTLRRGFTVRARLADAA